MVRVERGFVSPHHNPLRLIGFSLMSAIRFLAAVILAAVAAAPARAQTAKNPREQSVLDALHSYETAVLASDTVTLKKIWADDYTFINAQGVIATKAQRLANFASGATSVADARNHREITVRVYGDNAILQQLFTLHGTFGGQETNTEVRCTFVWLWKAGRWQMTANELTPIAS
jgi:ketosteroid isomerase-like protein